MNEPAEGAILAIFSAKGFVMNNHQMKVPQHPYDPPKLSEFFSIYCFALELTNNSVRASDPVAISFRLVRSLPQI
jgi:hypothetical protein